MTTTATDKSIVWNKNDNKKIQVEVSKAVAVSPIYACLSKKVRTRDTLEELIVALKTVKEQKNPLQKINVRDEGLGGTFLHYLTDTATAEDE